MEKPAVLSLANLARGAAIEIFDNQLARVLDNILDPNTTEAAREIHLKVKFKPNDNRDLLEVTTECSSRVSFQVPIKTQIFIGRTAEGIVASEYHPKQLGLEFKAPFLAQKGEEKA